MVSANLLRLVRLSAPSWLRIPGSISVSCLVSACPVIVKVLAAKDAWTFGLLKWITVPWFVNIFTCRETQKNLKRRTLIYGYYQIGWMKSWRLSLLTTLFLIDFKNLNAELLSSVVIFASFDENLAFQVCPKNGSYIGNKGWISQSSSCTSSIPEMLLTPSFLRENCSFLSSAVAVLCTTFFFLRADPYRAQ